MSGWGQPYWTKEPVGGGNPTGLKNQWVGVTLAATRPVGGGNLSRPIKSLLETEDLLGI